jgi:hypothetical protein
MSEMRCKHCNRPRAQHWTNADEAFCSSVDLPGCQLFSDVVSDQGFEPVDDATTTSAELS